MWLRRPLCRALGCSDGLAPHYDEVTATASDDDGNSDAATDDETVYRQTGVLLPTGTICQ